MKFVVQVSNVPFLEVLFHDIVHDDLVWYSLRVVHEVPTFQCVDRRGVLSGLVVVELFNCHVVVEFRWTFQGEFDEQRAHLCQACTAAPDVLEAKHYMGPVLVVLDGLGSMYCKSNICGRDLILHFVPIGCKW